ncbi:MAG TPA: VOC family protein, partial [Acidimicrobiales bacterium]|nr:VOC family protein [Acidimicrobiales bacterium]
AGGGDDEIWHADVHFPNGASLHVDNVALAATYNAAWRRGGGGSAVVVGFTVASRDDVDHLYRKLTDAGVEGRQVPYDAFWGARYAIVADPNGVDVGIMSPIDEAHRSWPPSPSPDE